MLNVAKLGPLDVVCDLYWGATSIRGRPILEEIRYLFYALVK